MSSLDTILRENLRFDEYEKVKAALDEYNLINIIENSGERDKIEDLEDYLREKISEIEDLKNEIVILKNEIENLKKELENEKTI